MAQLLVTIRLVSPQSSGYLHLPDLVRVKRKTLQTPTSKSPQNVNDASCHKVEEQQVQRDHMTCGSIKEQRQAHRVCESGRGMLWEAAGWGGVPSFLMSRGC